MVEAGVVEAEVVEAGVVEAGGVEAGHPGQPMRTAMAPCHAYCHAYGDENGGCDVWAGTRSKRWNRTARRLCP